MYHSVFFSKSGRNRGVPKNMIDGKQGQLIQRRATADYPRPQAHHAVRDRTSSEKYANKSLVTKISDKPSSSIPDVIASHEGHSPLRVADVKIANRNGPAETAMKEINHKQGVKTEKSEISSSQFNHAVTKVETNHENSPSKIYPSTTQPIVNGAVVDANVQVHRPATDVSLNTTSSRFIMDEQDLMTEETLDLLEPQNKPKRRSSITHSEKEALGTLDDVLRDFDDVDDNLDEIDQTESKASQVQPVNSDLDLRYDSIADIKQSLMGRDDEKQNSDSNYNLTPSAVEQKQDTKDLVPPTQFEHLYAKPIKPKNDATASNSPKKVSSKIKVEAAPEKSPVVPPKRFIEDNYEIKFSPLRKTSPSASLSKSLNNTTWANANEIPSPKRKPLKDKNDNFSLKRGQLSGPIPIITDDDYVEPPPDYDINATLSSIGKSTTDDSFTRDTWGSMTSSSTSGSRKVKKEFRPEVLKMIQKKNAEKEKAENEDRHYDGLVNRSFQVREASLKSASKSSLKAEETDNKSDIDKDFTKIKDEADRWLDGFERMRASSEGKKELALKSKSGKTNDHKKEETSAAKVENGSQADTVPHETQATDDIQVANDNITIASTKKEKHQTTEIKNKTTNKTKDKSKKHLRKNGEDDSDDENLIRLMETGVSSMEEASTDCTHPQPKMFGYVPRALRMSFGQSWDGIRKDRREWKSREVKHASSQSSRKGGKNLSNRFDDQKEELEMLF